MKKNIIWIVLIIVVGAGSFYGGMLYGKQTNASSRPGLGQFQNLTNEQRQQFQQNGGQRRVGQGTGAGGGFATGEILSKDDASVTIKLQNGGSKIIFYSGSTTVGKTTTGTTNDLIVGENVTANGVANSDGSITAQQIQIRPAMPMPSSNPAQTPMP